jgi:hypothetical protein
MVIDQMKKQMSDGNSTCPLDPMDKQNSNGHFQVHWIHCIHWTLSFGYLNGLVSTWCPYACHYVIQIYINWPTEKQMSDGNSACPLDPMDKQNSNGHFQVHWIHWIHWTLLFGYLNGNPTWKSHLSIGYNGQTKFQWTFPGPLDPLDTFVWPSQWLSVYIMSICLSLRHSDTY